MVDEIEVLINYIKSEKGFTEDHLQEIRIGIEHGLQPAIVLLYAKPRYTKEEVKYMRDRVEKFSEALHNMKFDKY